MQKAIWSAAAVLSVCMSSPAFAEVSTPKNDQRQANQEQRMDQGIASQREADRRSNQQDHINAMEDKAKPDGAVTKKERAKQAKSHDRTSRRIARQKHDDQQR